MSKDVFKSCISHHFPKSSRPFEVARPLPQDTRPAELLIRPHHLHAQHLLQRHHIPQVETAANALNSSPEAHGKELPQLFPWCRGRAAHGCDERMAHQGLRTNGYLPWWLSACRTVVLAQNLAFQGHFQPFQLVCRPVHGLLITWSSLRTRLSSHAMCHVTLFDVLTELCKPLWPLHEALPHRLELLNYDPQPLSLQRPQDSSPNAPFGRKRRPQRHMTNSANGITKHIYPGFIPHKPSISRLEALRCTQPWRISAPSSRSNLKLIQKVNEVMASTEEGAYCNLTWNPRIEGKHSLQPIQVTSHPPSSPVAP